MGDFVVYKQYHTTPFSWCGTIFSGSFLAQSYVCLTQCLRPL